MDASDEHAMLLEALSDKVLHQLPPKVWQELFLGPGRESIRFEQRHLTLVHAEAQAAAGAPGSTTERFYADLQRLNARYNGRLDPYVDAAAVVTFEDPGAAMRMAMELQRAAGDVRLKVGVASGPCTLAFFRVHGRLWCTPLGAQPARAAQVAATAAVGGIVISPEAQDQEDTLSRPERLGVHADFQDSERDLSCLGAAPREAALEVDIPC